MLIQETLFINNKIINKKSHLLIDIIPKRLSNYFSRIHANIPMLRKKKEYFKNYFLSSSISQWNKLDINIGNASYLASFKYNFLKFIRPISNSICNILNLEAVARRCSVKKVLYQISFFSCEFWENFRNTFFIEHLRWLLLISEKVSSYWQDYDLG